MLGVNRDPAKGIRRMQQFDGYILLTEAMQQVVNPKSKPYMIMEGLCSPVIPKTPKNSEGNKSKKIILYTGALWKHDAGIEYFVDGFLRAGIKDAELHFYGVGELVEWLKRIEKRHPNIKYKGVLPNDKIVEKQLEASLLVNPRPSGEEFCVYSFPSKTKASNVCSRSELTKCTIGRYTYIGYQNFMVNVSIGSFCSIADRCSIGGAIHPMEYVSTSPVFHEGGNILRKNFSKHPMQKTPRTVIEHDVWIG